MGTQPVWGRFSTCGRFSIGLSPAFADTAQAGSNPAGGRLKSPPIGATSGFAAFQAALDKLKHVLQDGEWPNSRGGIESRRRLKTCPTQCRDMHSHAAHPAGADATIPIGDIALESRSRWWNRAALALLVCTALVLLASPVFPSQDGPVHLYYVDVLRGLLTHSAPYAQHFAIKSFVTPYALEYYSLLALETVFSPAVSEKLLLCAYIFAFGLGFRYLVESAAERGSPWTLAGIPFCLHLLVYMGFLNYSFGVALLLFLCGFWMRFSGHLTPGRAAALVAGVVLMLLTHPVPVAAFLLFIGVYLVADLVQDAALDSWSWMAPLRARLRPMVLMAAMGAMALLWVGLFVDRPRAGSTDPSYGSVFGWLNTAATELQLYPVAPFSGLRYRAGPILVVGAAYCAWITGSWKNGRRLRIGAVALAAVAWICFILFCAVPPRVNGSFYFAERFPILWVLFSLAAAAALRLPRRWSAAAGGGAACVTVCVLLMQWGQISRMGSQIAPALDSPPAAAGTVGLIIGSKKQMPEGLSFDPYMWSGAHYFRRSRAILANDPWMNLPIIMLRPVHPTQWSYLDPDDASPVLIAAIAGGTAAGNPAFVVQEGPSDFEIDGLMKRKGWNDFGSSQFLRMYRHQP